MDRGQIFVGVQKTGLQTREEVNGFLSRYDFQLKENQVPGLEDEVSREVSRLDGSSTQYRLHYNDETSFPKEGFIFGLEAVTTYTNFQEEDSSTGKVPESITDGYDRDWIQEIDLERLTELQKTVQQDIPDAAILLMDMHY